MCEDMDFYLSSVYQWSNIHWNYIYMANMWELVNIGATTRWQCGGKESRKAETRSHTHTRNIIIWWMMMVMRVVLSTIRCLSPRKSVPGPEHGSTLCFNTQVLHTEAFTHKKYLHREAFTQRSLYTEGCLMVFAHRRVTHRSFTPLPTEALKQMSLYTRPGQENAFHYTLVFLKRTISAEGDVSMVDA